MDDPQVEVTHPKTVYQNRFFRVSYIKEIDAYFINDWEVKIGMVITVVTIIVSSYVVYMVYGVQNNATLKLTVLGLMFLYTYFATILEGPGYLPFYYPYKLSDDCLAGVQVNEEQLDFVRAQPRPPRCRFFKTARRIVIRPDHYCGWLNTWIGKKNHKLFFCFSVYGFMYCAYYSYLMILRFKSVFEAKSFDVLPMILTTLYMCAG